MAKSSHSKHNSDSENSSSSREKSEKKDQDNTDLLGDKLLFDEPKAKAERKEASAEVAQAEKKPAVDHELEKDDEGYVEIKELNPKNDSPLRINKDKDIIHVKISKSHLIWIERIAYWVIILVLIILLIKGPVAGIFDTGNISNLIAPDSVQADPGIQTPVANAAAQANQSANAIPVNASGTAVPKVWAKRNSTCVEIPLDINSDEDSYGSKAVCEIALGGSINTSGNTDDDVNCSATGTPEIKMLDVNMDSNNNKKIDSIEIEIRNKGNTDLEEFQLNLIWYNANDDSDIRTIPKLKETGKNTAGKRVYDTLLISKCSGVKVIELDEELVTKYVTSRDVENTFKITLENLKGKEIDSYTYKLPKD